MIDQVVPHETPRCRSHAAIGDVAGPQSAAPKPDYAAVDMLP